MLGGRYTPNGLSVKTVVRIALLAALIIIFFVLAREVRQQDTLSFDELTLREINQHADLQFDRFFAGVTQLGGVFAGVLITVALATIFALRKQWRRVLIVVAGMGGVLILNVSLKLLFERVRPDLWQQIVVETSFSFPSGHAMASAGLAFLIGYFVWRSMFPRWMKRVLYALLIVYIILIALSRLYLGVHYPTDIIGGWLISIAWMTAIIPLITHYRSKRQRVATSNT